MLPLPQGQRCRDARPGLRDLGERPLPAGRLEGECMTLARRAGAGGQAEMRRRRAVRNRRRPCCRDEAVRGVQKNELAQQ